MSQAFFGSGSPDPATRVAKTSAPRNKNENGVINSRPSILQIAATRGTFISNLRFCDRCESLLSYRPRPMPIRGLIVRRHRLGQIVRNFDPHASAYSHVNFFGLQA